MTINLFWLLASLGACPDALVWARGRWPSAATWGAADDEYKQWVLDWLSGYGCGDTGYVAGYGADYGDGYGCGACHGGDAGDGSGYGEYYGYANGFGEGNGHGGAGYGAGHGAEFGDGYGLGDGDGHGDGYVYGYGHGSSMSTHIDILSLELDGGLVLKDGTNGAEPAALILGRLWMKFGRQLVDN